MGLEAGLKAYGSFVSAKPLPNDFDACWDMTGISPELLDAVLLMFDDARAAQKQKYLGEFFPAQLQAESRPPHRLFLDFFQVD